MPVTATSPPLPGDQNLFRRAASHATFAFPTHLALWLATQFTATADTLDKQFALDENHMATVTAMAWETLSLPARPAEEDKRVQNVAKALWENDFPPDRHMPWADVAEGKPTFVARYLDLAKAALVADEAEHQRLDQQASQWHEAWSRVDQDRPDEPPAAVVESLANWLVDHNIGIVDEGDNEEEGDPVYMSLESMRQLAERLLTSAPGMRRAANSQPTEEGP